MDQKRKKDFQQRAFSATAVPNHPYKSPCVQSEIHGQQAVVPTPGTDKQVEGLGEKRSRKHRAAQFVERGTGEIARREGRAQ